MSSNTAQRVLSGMRPTGPLHLGHYHGVLKNWLTLQNEHECFFFVADWHALTTEYDDPQAISENTWNMVIDWLAVGIDPSTATVFIQSRVPEHAELHLLLSMYTPMSWLKRVPTYRDQQEKLSNKNLSTYGFLGYPLLQAADILIYKAGNVPVGEDQVAHVELCREIARRFNYLYGREPGFEEKAELAAKRMGKKNNHLYYQLRKDYQQHGDAQVIEKAHALIAGQQNISIGDRERLIGYLEGRGKVILPEPQALLTTAPKLSGMDGRKMSNSYSNTISLRENASSIEEKIKTMPTDPQRVRRDDPGDPLKCPVWKFHEIYSNDDTIKWVESGCRAATIGCLDCKGPLIASVLKEQVPICEKIKEYQQDMETVRGVINNGGEKAREIARQTINEVKQAMGLNHR